MIIQNKVINCQTLKWSELKKYEFNDLKSTNRDITKLKNSIVNDGFCFPVYIWSGHRYVIDGNGRNLALSELEKEGYKVCDIPVVEIEAETKQEAKLRVLQVSSTHGEVSQESFNSFTAEMNMDLIKDSINFDNIDYDFSEDYSLDDQEPTPDVLDDKYSHKIGQVIYEPKETNHVASDLFSYNTSFDNDINSLENEEIKKMLFTRAGVFSNFNFEKIADYYAYQATPEEQRVFERLGLVLLDKDQLIENGFADLVESVMNENN